MRYITLGLLLLAINAAATDLSAYNCRAYTVKIINDNIEVERSLGKIKSSTKVNLKFSSKEKDEATSLTTTFYTGKGLISDALGIQNVEYSLSIERITKIANLTALYVTEKGSIISAASHHCEKII